jgi:S1-C subfamily serine protease
MSSVVLDMDTTQYVSASTISNSDVMLDDDVDGEEKVMSEEETSEDFLGVVVFSVRTNGIAYKAGVRPGDVVLATSATLGDVSF